MVGCSALPPQPSALRIRPASSNFRRKLRELFRLVDPVRMHVRRRSIIAGGQLDRLDAQRADAADDLIERQIGEERGEEPEFHASLFK